MQKFLRIMLILTISLTALCNTFKSNLRVFAEGAFLVDAKSAYLIDAESGTLIFSKNENERLPIASMTKIMLLLLIFEAESRGEISFDSQIKVSENASGMGGSQVFLEKDCIYRVEDLVKSIIIASANDASVAMAEELFGSEQNAVDAMNDRANSLHLQNTLFSNCTGLMKPNQYSCAKDVSVMLCELIKYKKYFNYSKIYLDEISHANDRSTTLTNTNKLIKVYNGCDGGKTGFTNESGYCLAATAKRGSMRVIAVVINEQNSKTRFNDVCNMFDFAFDNFTSRAVLSANEPLEIKAKVLNGKYDYVKIVPEYDVHVFCKKNQKFDIQIEFKPKQIKAPIKKDCEVGSIIVYKDNVKIKELSALAYEDVDKMNYFDYFWQITAA